MQADEGSRIGGALTWISSRSCHLEILPEVDSVWAVGMSFDSLMIIRITPAGAGQVSFLS